MRVGGGRVRCLLSKVLMSELVIKAVSFPPLSYAFIIRFSDAFLLVLIFLFSIFRMCYLPRYVICAVVKLAFFFKQSVSPAQSCQCLKGNITFSWFIRLSFHSFAYSVH